jgi:hypothetical protein
MSVPINDVWRVLLLVLIGGAVGFTIVFLYGVPAIAI